MSTEQQELIDELSRRFPLFERIVGHFSNDKQRERIPWFFALILKAATTDAHGPCCFVLDKTLGTTALAAVLLSFARLQENFPQLIERYACTALSRGQRVKVKPNHYVYEYDGLWDGYPGFFRLKVMGEEEYRTFPMADMLRLEPTSRVRPKGKLASDLGTSERSRIDELLDLGTCGNNSVLCNFVLLYMAQARFNRVVNTVALAPRHVDDSHLYQLSDILSWGSIDRDGNLTPNDDYQLAGEPIIGVTNVAEDLALASSLATAATKVVLVDGAHGMARDLQAFDDIASRQRTVILASPEEAESLKILNDRGCPIWYMSPDEVLIGETSCEDRVRTSLIGRTIRAADTRQRVKMTWIECHDSTLEQVAMSLGTCCRDLEYDEETREGEEILAGLFGILLECSECCFGVGEETINKLQIVCNKLIQYSRWISQEVSSKLQETIDKLNDVIGCMSYGQDKADKILELISQKYQESWAVVARYPRTAVSLQRGLAEHGFDISVLPVTAVSNHDDFTGIIVPGWPNERRFTQLKNCAVTPDIRLLTYPFETEWVRRHQARERARVRSSRMEIERRSAILGIESRLLDFLEHHKTDPPTSEGRFEFNLPIFRIEESVAQRRVVRPSVAVAGEDSREARLVHFVGDCYALLTEWAELPVLNHLINRGTEARLTTAQATQLSPGDSVLFRESGDKELVRLIAEQRLGADEYNRVRGIAKRWKIALRRLGTNAADIQTRMVAEGLDRTVPTVAAWLNNRDRIGPRSMQDIVTIARMAGDNELLLDIEEVKSAIVRIRGAHIAAGGELTQLILRELGERLQQLDDQPLLVDLNYGNAWVVQVYTVETARQNYPSDLVNRLLWADDTAF